MPLGMTTLSSEFLAQSTIPFRPFMGKLMSVATDDAGSLWMLATKKTIQRGIFYESEQVHHIQKASTQFRQTIIFFTNVNT